MRIRQSLLPKQLELEKLMQLFTRLITEREEKAEIALARKVLAVSGGHYKIKGFTQTKRLRLITDKMLEIIPDEFNIVEAQLTDKEKKV